MSTVIAEFPASHLTILSTLRRPVQLPQAGRLFSDIKNDILGVEYELSLVFIGSTRSRSLNASWRNKDKPADVLSFPIAETAGEMFIAPKVADRSAPSFDRSTEMFYVYLFIHGCFHLKGMTHGSRMDTNEEQVRRRYHV